MAHRQQLPVISESTACRLFNTVLGDRRTSTTATAPEMAATEAGSSSQVAYDSAANGVIDSDPSPLPTSVPMFGAHSQLQESVHSANENGNSCRICRWNRSDMEIINCPCKCKGSVGYIHLKCLRRWIVHRHDNRCEICNAVFDLSEERMSVKKMMRTFWCGRCCGLIVKHVMFSLSLMPLGHIILQQVLQCMETLNQGSAEQLTVQEVFIASCALLTSSGLFFHFFEFVTTRCLLIRNILRHWWMFGSTSDYSIFEIEDDVAELF
ncbi:uncharacterized protein LOC108165476 [Drosophila miranda]|uniref:uncharacterized protein LOC108165476 n=1 Tax=Drosophila miranda TaxID=7229 RepID=UPI0007E6E3F5|nr:uncharacterized protein LOC108165476 [Drosophila miranda]